MSVTDNLCDLSVVGCQISCFVLCCGLWIGLLVMDAPLTQEQENVSFAKIPIRACSKTVIDLPSYLTVMKKLSWALCGYFCFVYVL